MRPAGGGAWANSASMAGRSMKLPASGKGREQIVNLAAHFQVAGAGAVEEGPSAKGVVNFRGLIEDCFRLRICSAPMVPCPVSD